MLAPTSQKESQTSSQSKRSEGFFFQPKLTINQPNDVYEQEADAVADKVMRMPDTSPFADIKPFFSPPTVNINTAITAKEEPLKKENKEEETEKPLTEIQAKLSFDGLSLPPDDNKITDGNLIQRKCAHCEEEEKKLQRKEINNSEPFADTSTENYISSLNGKGKSLTSNERKFFEPRIGYDFPNVQLHTNIEANQSAKSVNALAYTHGNNIVFGANQYQPSTDDGKKLIAHELTHVLQQKNSKSLIHREPADKDVDSPPLFFVRATPIEPLPGNKVEGVVPPYNKQKHQRLKDALKIRIDVNKKRKDDFLSVYIKSVVSVWLDYYNELIRENEDGASSLLKITGFIIRESLLFFLFPEGEIERIAAKIVEKATTFGLELAQESILEKGRNDEKDKNVENEMKNKLVELLITGITPIINTFADATDYVEWVYSAKDDDPDLKLFRIPWLIPKLSEEKTESYIAQLIIGSLHEKRGYGGVLPNRENQINIETEIEIPSFSVSHGRWSVISNKGGFFGSPSLRRAIANSSYSKLPKIPISIILKCSFTDLSALRQVFGSQNINEWVQPIPKIDEFYLRTVDPIDALIQAYPTQSPIHITRDGSGIVEFVGGGIMEHLFLYGLANPGNEIGYIIREVAEQRAFVDKATQTSELPTPKKLAHDIFKYTYNSRLAGAEIYVKEIEK